MSPPVPAIRNNNHRTNSPPVPTLAQKQHQETAPIMESLKPKVEKNDENFRDLLGQLNQIQKVTIVDGKIPNIFLQNLAAEQRKLETDIGSASEITPQNKYDPDTEVTISK